MLFYIFGFLAVHFCSGVLTPDQRASLLERHNHYRRQEALANRGSGMIEMEWDFDLETVAQNFADSGAFAGHNSNRKSQYENLIGSPVSGVGENWFSGPPIGSTYPSMPEDAVHAWVDFVWPSAWTGQPDDCSERQAFNGECTGMTGHFTQVLWEGSYKVGCGYTSTHGTTCNYYPAGNVIGYPHATNGNACGTCPTSHPNCANSLCAAAPVTPTPAPTTPPPTPPTPPPTPSPTSSCTFQSIDWSRGSGCSAVLTCDGICYSPLPLIQQYYDPNQLGSTANYNMLKGYGINLNCPRFCCGLQWESDPCGLDVGAFGDDQEDILMVRKSEPVYMENTAPNTAINHYVYFSSIFSLSLIYMFF